MCTGLSSTTKITTGNGVTETVTISLTTSGSYNGCTLRVTDHGGNIGSYTMPNFTVELTPYAVCNDRTITVPQSECVALGEFYVGTNGDSWTDNTNWMVSTDIDTWF